MAFFIGVLADVRKIFFTIWLLLFILPLPLLFLSQFLLVQLKRVGVFGGLQLRCQGKGPKTLNPVISVNPAVGTNNSACTHVPKRLQQMWS